MKNSLYSNGFTRIEMAVAIAVAVVLAAIIPGNLLPMRGGMTVKGLQTKSLSNAKEIAKACILFAADHDGKFPDGSYNKGEPGGTAGKKSHEAFTDIIESGIIKQEYFFWNPRAKHVCSTIKPNEDGQLDAGECAYDYVAGMITLKENNNLPLVFEACTTHGIAWEKSKGHPWDKKVIVVNCDGSGNIMDTGRTGMIKVKRVVGKPGNETVGDLLGTDPAANSFPTGAFYAPAK